MVFSVFQLVSNSIKFSWQSNLIDSELDTLGKSLTAIGLLGLVFMAAVQFIFAKEMGEVYIKIRSENPEESNKKLRLLKFLFILAFSAEGLAFVLRQLQLFYGSEIEKNPVLDRVLKVALIISFCIVLVLVIPQVFKFYMFFARLKLKQLKSEQKMTCQRMNFLILPILVSIFYIAFCCVLISEVLLQFVSKD